MSNSNATETSFVRKSEEAFDSALNVVVLGTGNIGRQFLKLLQDKIQFNGVFKLVAVANSRYFQLNTDGLTSIEPNQTAVDYHDNSQGQLFHELEVLLGVPTVVIDLTASEAVAEHYLRFAQNGWHIISANKIAAANHDYAGLIESALKLNQARWLKNTTVGAALPVQDAIKKIIQSGDQLRQVSGVFSGSISWLLTQYNGQNGFSEWIRKAQQHGLTEPDPRADLSGLDVFRKAQILARTCGFEPAEINFQAVLPQQYLKGDINDFWQRQDAIDRYLLDRWHAAQEAGMKLSYLAEVSAKRIRIELTEIDDSHAAAYLKAGDNVYVIESDFYHSNPLVIQGPGAGIEVTAAGVFNDLVELIGNRVS